MENEEKKYEDVIKALKGLKKVNAPENFETDLKRRINSEKYSEKERKGFWENIFVPAKLIPSLGLVAVAVIIFFVVDTNSEEMDNPFLIEPRLREDVFEVTDYEDIQEHKEKELPESKSLKKEVSLPKGGSVENEMKSDGVQELSGRKKAEEVDGFFKEENFARDRGVTEGEISVPESTFADAKDSPKPTVTLEASSEIATDQSVSRDELNFRQIQLNEDEQRVVNELRNQVQSSEEVHKTQK